MPIVANQNLRTRRKEREEALARIPDSAKDDYEIPEETLRDAFHDFHGETVFRGDPEYEKDRLGHNLYPQLAHPLVIAYCETEPDVAFCLKVAHKFRKQDVPFTCRGGGHSNAGYCMDTGMVIDVSKMNGICLMHGGASAHVQAGATLGALNRTLAPHNLHVPGGECDTVGVAGHSMGGGYGFTSRMFGLNCDCVISARLMLADGRTVTADASTNPDLFWAVRGGTGNNFGVLLSLEYKTATLPDLWAFVLSWPIEQAPQVMPVLQDAYIRKGLTPDMGYQVAWAPFEGNADDERICMMGMYKGASKDGCKLLEQIRKVGTPWPIKETVGPYVDLNPYLLEWCHDPPPETSKEIKQSNFVARTLLEEEWQQILHYYRTKPNMYDMVAFEIYGGKATKPGVSNAYIHREVDFDMFIDSFSNPAWTTDKEARDWLRGFDRLVQRFSNTHKYQNYPNRDNVDYRWNYWGKAFPKLLRVKQMYDPENFFSFEQAITPDPNRSDFTESDAEPRIADPAIEYESFGGMA